jgi:hypothetical protein
MQLDYWWFNFKEDRLSEIFGDQPSVPAPLVWLHSLRLHQMPSSGLPEISTIPWAAWLKSGIAAVFLLATTGVGVGVVSNGSIYNPSSPEDGLVAAGPGRWTPFNQGEDTNEGHGGYITSISDEYFSDSATSEDRSSGRPGFGPPTSIEVIGGSDIFVYYSDGLITFPDQSDPFAPYSSESH